MNLGWVKPRTLSKAPLWNGLKALNKLEIIRRTWHKSL
jgi:hypothetical protein